MRLVKIIWEDACEVDATPWAFTFENEEYESKLVNQVGYVVKETEKHFILTHALTLDQIARRNLIPKGMVKEVIELGDH
jgi:hypothetical protein